MRAFGDQEKQLIHRIIKLDNKPDSLNVLGNIIDSNYGESLLPDHCFVSIISSTNVSIKMRKEAFRNIEANSIKSVESDTTKILITVVTLFEYLEAKKLITLLGDHDFSTLGKECDGEKYENLNLLNDGLKPLVYKYSRKEIFVSESLRALVKNKFLTAEEKRNKEEMSVISEQLTFTRILLVISTLGLIASILIPVVGTSAIVIKNEKVITELSEKSVLEVGKVVKTWAAPLITEFEKTQGKLDKISNAIKEANNPNSNALQKSSKTISTKINDITKNITNSIDPIERSLAESQSKKIQPTAD